MNPDKIPNLHGQLASTYHNTNVGQLGLQTSDISTHGVGVDTISQVGGNKYKGLCGTTLNTDTTALQSNTDPIVCFVIPISNKV